MKKCSICKQIKSLDEFGVRAFSKDGRKEACKPCLNEKQKLYYRTEKGQKRAKIYESEKRKLLKISPKCKKKTLEERKEHAKQTKRLYGQRDYVIKKSREKSKRFRKDNPGIVRFRTAEYRARKNNAMPKWLTKEEKKFIIGLYKHAKYIEKMFGIKCHVDHIIPLRGENVCGLHVPWNLQILTAEDNLKKGNRL